MMLTRRETLLGLAATLAGLGTAGRAAAAREDPMLQIRHADGRGQTRLPWLDSRHSFSFADYHDPAHMGFRALRVINDDRIAGGGGFGTHPHRDMEIVTYVLDGALEHRDSLGTGSLIRPGEVQRMSAGTGIRHSEYNASAADPVHLLQIWILPERAGLPPSYEQRALPPAAPGRLPLIGSRDGRDGSVTIHQDVELYGGPLAAGAQVAHTLAPGRHAWLQVARGRVTANGQPLGPGDGASLSTAGRLELRAEEAAEVLLFDLG